MDYGLGFRNRFWPWSSNLLNRTGYALGFHFFEGVSLLEKGVA
jgi:hypothetical protein